MNFSREDPQHEFSNIQPTFEIRTLGGVLGKGVFWAGVTIAAGVDIGTYTGIVRKVLPHERDGAYQVTLCDYTTYRVDVDAEKGGNEARYINDYRGITKRPNVRLLVGNDNEVTVSTVQQIQKGDQLLLDYGTEYWMGSRSKMEVEQEGFPCTRCSEMDLTYLLYTTNIYKSSGIERLYFCKTLTNSSFVHILAFAT